jgi:histidinol-phosphatase (PHP family)
MISDMTDEKHKTNYHTHTYRCMHAVGDVRDYCEAAIAAGLTTLGISDHTPLPDGKWPGIRMGSGDLESYCADVLSERERLVGKLDVRLGMECEYFPRYANFYEDVLRGQAGVEYLALGLHFYPYDGAEVSTHHFSMNEEALESYTDLMVDAIRSGLFDFVAHPDLFMAKYPDFDAHARRCSERICRAAADMKTPLEINGYGFSRTDFTGYPNYNFWQVAKENGAKAIINSDAHRPQDIAVCFDKCLALAAETGLEIQNSLSAS